MFDLPPPRHISTLRFLPIARRSGDGLLSDLRTGAQLGQREVVFMPDAVRKPFCALSARKIDSNSMPHAYQRYAETASSILLLRPDNGSERFPTACTHRNPRVFGDFTGHISGLMTDRKAPRGAEPATCDRVTD